MALPDRTTTLHDPDTFRVELRPPVPLGLADEVRRRVLFASADIERFDLVTDADAVVAVAVQVAPGAEHDAVERKLTAVVDSDVRNQFLVPSKVVWSSSGSRPLQPDVYDDLARTGAVAEVGEGQVLLGEPVLGLFEYFDRALVDLLAASFDTRQYRYPTLIATATLEAAGYFDAFPHHLMLVTRLHNDADVYRGLRERASGDAATLLGACRNVDYCLPPTMCYHTFAQHRGTTMGRGGVEVVTARGKSFRYEAGYATTLERLWDFTIREMVFMGRRDEVLAARQLVMTKTFALLEELGLGGRCEVGNDPFFGNVDTADRIASQRMLELKYELQLPVADARTIAVGSFNFHGDLFGQSFGIAHDDGGPIFSGCVGFGLERLVYAFLCQYGTDPGEWPPAVRTGAR